jgi:rhodanese-related sulfurtransferase
MAGLVERISPQQAHQRLEFNNEAMLVCAYDSDEKFHENHLEGAISLAEFEAQVGSIPKDREIIFYCA